MISLSRLALALLMATVFLCCQQKKAEDRSAQVAGTSAPQGTISPEEARSIAKEAYIYGYPMMDSYRIQFAYFIAKDNTEYKVPFNQLTNTARVFTPEDKTVQTPNSDTPYSMVGFDLRREPMVITLPSIESNRYFSVQLIDAYTHNFAYIGTRTTGNKGGSYLIAGPNWRGELPRGITQIIPSETEFALAVIRTQLFNPKDIENVKAIQAKYKVQPLSEFLGMPAPQAVPEINFIRPLSIAQQRTTLESFNLLSFLLQFCPVHPSEVELRQRFEKIGIKPGGKFDSTAFSPEILSALQMGIKDAWADFRALKTGIDKGEVQSGSLFGTREFQKNNYLNRMAGAIIGIYGNSREEALYPAYLVDSEGNEPNGANKYIIRFEKGKLPPVSSFWSITMYEMPASLLVENPIKRYLINSPMLPSLKKDKDGGITLYIQNESPGKDKESNWLPAPKGPFALFMRLYGPKPEALSGEWKRPALVKQG